MNDFVENWKPQYTQALVGLFVVGLIAGLGYLGWDVWTQGQEKKYQAEYGVIESEIDKNSAKTPTEEQRKQWREKLKNLVEAAPHTVAAKMAALKSLQLGNSTSELGEDEALLTRVQGGKNFVSGLVKLALGNVQADQGKCDAAVAIWGEMVKSGLWKFLDKEAELRQALCLQKLNKSDQAQVLFDKLASDREAFIYQKQAQKLSREGASL